MLKKFKVLVPKQIPLNFIISSPTEKKITWNYTILLKSHFLANLIGGHIPLINIIADFLWKTKIMTKIIYFWNPQKFIMKVDKPFLLTIKLGFTSKMPKMFRSKLASELTTKLLSIRITMTNLEFRYQALHCNWAEILLQL